MRLADFAERRFYARLAGLPRDPKAFDVMSKWQVSLCCLMFLRALPYGIISYGASRLQNLS